METEALCGAAPGERTAERRNQRNGSRLFNALSLAGLSPICNI
jgi:hypothetical protein